MSSTAQNLTLLTDLYELTMMQGYFKNPVQETVIFDAFYRVNPCGNGAAGLEQVIDYIKNLRFSEEDVEYLGSLGIFEKDFLDYLKDFRFSGDIYAIPEGTVVFPREPLIKVIAPIMEAQLVETAILNIINHQSLIATKAARVVNAARGDGVMEFGLRRAQGPDAGTYGARAAMIGGCIGTSNVLCGQLFDVPVLGTHAHSWIMSFPDEYTAFKTYAELYPNACTLLVDTYDTLKSGVPNAIRVFKEMRRAKKLNGRYGIRLDSGDLAYLSKEARKMLDAAGFKNAIISASSDLDEYLIDSLKSQGAQTGDGDFVPKIKLSENSEKVTNPGNKTVYRIYEKANGKLKADLISLVDDRFDESKDLVIFDPVETWKKTHLKGGTYTMRELMVKVFDKGECVYESPSVMDIREYCFHEQETLWDETRRLVNPHEVYVDLSDRLYKIKTDLLNQMHAGE